jgi:hypothetical protein
VFLDVEGFWAPMGEFLDRAVAANVLHGGNRPLFKTAPTAAAALDVLAAW